MTIEKNKQKQQRDVSRQEKKDVCKERERKDWIHIFMEIFDSNFPDEWDLTLEIPENLTRREQKYELNLKCGDAHFRCPDCRRTWTSVNGRVCFWIWRDHRDGKGYRQGHVMASVLGQKCKPCLQKNKNVYYITGQVSKVGIKSVLQQLFAYVDCKIYHNKSAIEDHSRKQTYRPREEGRPPHYVKGCQACELGICKMGRVESQSEKAGPNKI